MRACRLTAWSLLLISSFPLEGSARAGPEIFGLTPETGPAGIQVQIKGKGLKTTRHVIFAVGRTLKTARFRVVSDEEVHVVAPEYYRPDAAATVAVLTPSGLTVAMPATVQIVRSRTQGHNAKEPGASFYHVLKGGRVTSAESIAVIEYGGVVDHSVTPAMQLVKHGGTLLDLHNPNGIVFHERGAIFGPKLMDPRHPSSVTFIQVAKITASPGVGPFIYQNPPRPDPGKDPAVPPWIQSVVPAAAGAGDVVTLDGTGFSRTTEVFFLDPTHGPRQAGFRVVSDRQIKLEVPDLDAITGPQLLAVVTTEGLTVTIPRYRTIHPGTMPTTTTQLMFAKLRDAICWIGPGDDASTVACRFYFVASGGLVDQVGHGATYFIQRGGTLGQEGPGVGPVGLRGGTARAVFFEPGAIVSQGLKLAPIGHEVRAIVPSFFDEPFLILPGHLFRR